MGEVYLAEDTLLGREVALKRLLPIFAEDEEFVSRFKREARAISRLTHPGLVSVHSLDWSNGVLLLDMEYVRGSSLLRTLQNSVVTPQFTARLAHDVLEALTECHEHGIVHRDIKPSNVLLTETQQAKLVDFGIATALADSTATQMREGRSTTIVLGTPRFMPPEAWDGGEVSPQWDLFSLGVVLYECLTGSPAFKGSTTAALAKQITNEPLTRITGRVPELSVQFATLVDRLVLINPENRCASAREALTLLEGAPELVISPEGSTVRRSMRKTAAQIFSRSRSRSGKRSLRLLNPRRRWVAALSLLTIAAAATGAYLALPRTPAKISADSGNEISAVISATQAASSDQFYYASTLDSAGENNWHWWIAPAAAGEARVVLGYNSVAVLRMTIDESPDGIRFAGEWAGFASPLGRGFEQGSVSGGGRWEQGRQVMAAILKFESRSHRTTHESSFLIEPESRVQSREDFLRKLESAQLIPTLVYREMSPRNLPLARAITNNLPAVGQRLSAPLLSDDAAPIVDGKLDELTWREPIYDASGRIGESVAVSGSRIIVRQTSAGLYMGFRTPRQGENAVNATIGIMLGVSNPPQWAPRGIFKVSDTGVTDRQFFTGESEVRFPDGWEIATSGDVSEWVIEIRVPFDTPPAAPWRFNLVLQGADGAGEAKSRVLWGDADVRNLAHGALISFGSTES